MQTTVNKESVVEEILYSESEKYWAAIPATVDGMLGGFGSISQVDIQGSKAFLFQLFRSKNPPGREYALECGAGIGRISKHLLLLIFKNVDLIEQNRDFLDKASEYIGPKLYPKIGQLYPMGLQDFLPQDNKYDVIWIQWVLGYLKNDDLVKFLKVCKSSLKPKGLVIVKENVTSSGEVEKDEQDSSVTRPLSAFRQLFILAGFDCYRVVKHSNFPKCLYNVYMFALQVLEDSETNTSTNVTEDTRSSQKDAVNCQSVSTPLSGKSENVEITNDPLVLNLKKLNISLDI